MPTMQFWRCAANTLSVKLKLLFVTTAVDETMAAIDAITDGDYAVLKARAQCSVKRRNKGKKN